MLDFHSGQRRRMSQRGLLETGFLEGEVRYAFAHQGDAFEFGCYEAPEDGTQYWLKFRRGGDNQPIEYSQALAAWTLEAEALQAGLRAAARGEVPAPEAESPPRRRGNAGFLKRLFGVGKK
jgi:hypothetical protein